MNDNYKFFSIAELAEALVKAPLNTAFDFTFDTKESLECQTEPEGWYGVKRVSLFGEAYGVVCFGYYGGDTTICKELGSSEKSEIAQHFIEWCKAYCDDKVNEEFKLCVEITSKNKDYLPCVTSGFDFCTNDELGDYFAFVETLVDLENSNSIDFTQEFDRDVELADLFRESYEKWPRSEMNYSDFIEDFLVSKQEECDSQAEEETK